jgi:16S rRNA (guanine(966)-N(2))-methyltransferase RsmD
VTAPRKPAREVRIIGGQWKRSKLPVADRPGLRPTPDRVRETLFNWLGQDLTGWRCLDPFSGSGALGFEAASRGASQVLMIERDPALANSLRATKDRLSAGGVQIEAGDGVGALRRAAGQGWNLVFLDPPYDAGILSTALQAATQAVAQGGLVYAESREALAELPAAVQVFREGRAGAVHFWLLRAQPSTLSLLPEQGSAP